MNGIIYLAQNTQNNKIYIGQTIQSLSSRKAGHYYSSKYRRNESYFHKALRKHEKHIFEWVVLESNISIDLLDDYEKFWITYFKYIGAELYNISTGGSVGRRGCKHSEKSKRLMSENRKGKPAWNKGIKSPYAVRNKSRSKQRNEWNNSKRRGVPLSEEHRMNISKSMKGIKRSDSQKQAQSERMSGRKLSDAHRENIRKANIGRKDSDETKQRKSESIKESWRRRKET